MMHKAAGYVIIKNIYEIRKYKFDSTATNPTSTKD
jgi:hypothetical protein